MAEAVQASTSTSTTPWWRHPIAWVALTVPAVLLLALLGRAVNPPHVAMTAWQAIILGLVEGITEYLPISSTGHLYITGYLLGLGRTPDGKIATDAYIICIQAGAILAVLVLYAGRVRSMLAGAIGRDPVGRRLAMNTLLAFAPAVLFGLLAEDMIKRYLFGPWPVVIAWLVGGIALLLIAGPLHGKNGGHLLEMMTARQALIIGVAQCLAMWPGTSRSLVTIVAGVLVGLRVEAAVEFSFLLGLITLGAATLYEGMQSGTAIFDLFGWINPLIGFLVAWVSAMVAVAWMVGYLQRHSLAIFGYYRIAVGVLFALLLLFQIVR